MTEIWANVAGTQFDEEAKNPQMFILVARISSHRSRFYVQLKTKTSTNIKTASQSVVTCSFMHHGRKWKNVSSKLIIGYYKRWSKSIFLQFLPTKCIKQLENCFQNVKKFFINIWPHAYKRRYAFLPSGSESAGSGKSTILTTPPPWTLWLLAVRS